MHRPSAPGRLTDQPVRAREERHEDQGANQDRHDVDRNLRVADAPHVDEAVGVLVREGTSHERVRHPRDRDQQNAPQRRPRDAAARTRERGRTHEGGRDDDVLERVGDQREAGQRFVGADERRVDDRGHRDHHQCTQVRRPPPRTHTASARENGRDDRNHNVGQLGEVGQAIDETLRGARPAMGGRPRQVHLARSVTNPVEYGITKPRIITTQKVVTALRRQVCAFKDHVDSKLSPTGRSPISC